MITQIQVFPYLIAVAEIVAALVYGFHHEWRLALVWGCVGAANFAFAGIK